MLGPPTLGPLSLKAFPCFAGHSCVSPAAPTATTMWRSVDNTTGAPVIRKPPSKDTQRVLTQEGFWAKGKGRGDSEDTSDSDSSSSNSSNGSDSKTHNPELSKLGNARTNVSKPKSSSPVPDGYLSSSRENLAAKSVAFDKRTRVVHTKSSSVEKNQRPADPARFSAKQQSAQGVLPTRGFGNEQPVTTSSTRDEFSLKRFLTGYNSPRRNAEPGVSPRPTISSREESNRGRQTKLDEKNKLGQFFPKELQSKHGFSMMPDLAPSLKTTKVRTKFGHDSGNEYTTFGSHDSENDFPPFGSRDVPSRTSVHEDSLRHSRATAARMWGGTVTEVGKTEGTGWEEGDKDDDDQENVSENLSHARKSAMNAWGNVPGASATGGSTSGGWEPDDAAAGRHRYGGYSSGKRSGDRKGEDRLNSRGMATGRASPSRGSASRNLSDMSTKPIGYWGVGDQTTRIDTFTSPSQTKGTSRKLQAMCSEILGEDSQRHRKRSEGKTREGEDSGSLDDTDDDLEHMLSSAARYVPPRRPSRARGNVSDVGSGSEEGMPWSPRGSAGVDNSRHIGERSHRGVNFGVDRTGEGERTGNWNPPGGGRNVPGRDNLPHNERDNWRQNERDNWRQIERDDWRQNDRDNWRQNNRDTWRQNDRDNWRQNDRENNGGDRDRDHRQPWRDPRDRPGRQQIPRERQHHEVPPLPRAYDRHNEHVADRNEGEDPPPPVNRHIPQQHPQQPPPPQQQYPQQQQQQQQNRGAARMPRPLEVNLSFGRLRDLRGKEPAEVVAALAYSKEGLQRLVRDEQKLTRDREMMRLLLTVLGKVSQCKSMPTQQNEVLNAVRVPEFFRVLGPFLTQSVLNCSPAEVVNIVADCADLLRTLLTIFPSSLSDVVGACAFLEVALKMVKGRQIELGEEVEAKVEELELAREAGFESLQRKQCKARNEAVDEDSLAPPDDFRQISVFPTIEDLEKEELPFLRKNKEKGGYVSLDHYLDVQFRLLREDFVYPLREGIAEYQKMLSTPGRGKRLKVSDLSCNVVITEIFINAETEACFSQLISSHLTVV